MTPADGTFSVVAHEVGAAASCLADEASTLRGIRLDAPDPTMYGMLVGSAAADAEPATTTEVNTLLSALASAVAALGDRADQTCAAYGAVEDDNAALGAAIGVVLGSGGVG